MADHDDFLRLYVPVQSALRRYVFAQIPDLHQAEDVLQEIAVVLWRKMDVYDRSQPFRQWAFGVARGEILHARRKVGRSRLVFSERLAERLQDAITSDESQVDERLDRLQVCLGKLGTQATQLVRLRYEQKKKSEEIAALLGQTATAIRLRLFRIRQALAACVRRREGLS